MSAALVRSNVIANYFGQGWAAIMGLVFLPAYVHYLGIESFALIGIFSLLQAWLSVLDFGMSSTLNREMARYTAGAHDAQSVNNLLRSVEVVCFATALTIAVGVWLASDWLAREWLRSEQLAPEVIGAAIAVMALVVAARFCEGPYRGAMFGLQLQVRYNVTFALLQTLRWAGSVGVLAWISPTIRAFFLWQALVSALSIVVFAASVKVRLPRPPAPPRFSRSALVGVWRFAGGMTLITVLVLLLTQVDKVLLSRLLPLAEFGYYVLAGNVAAGLTFLASPISQAYFPRLTELLIQRDETSLTTTYHQAAQLVAVLVVPAALVIAFNARDVIHLWSGDATLAANVAPLAILLCVGTLCNCLMVMPYMLQIADGWPALTVRVNAVGVVVLIPAVLWVAPRYGAVGAAWVWVALNMGYVLVSIHFMHRRLLPREKWRWYLVDVAAPLCASLVPVVLWHWLAPRPQSRILEGIGLALLSCAALGAAVLAAPSTRALAVRRLRNMLRRVAAARV